MRSYISVKKQPAASRADRLFFDGSAKIDAIMSKFRTNPLKEIAGVKVISIWDVKNSTDTDMLTGEVKVLDLPKSNVLRFNLDNNAWIAIRPSGTEPKIKFYYGVCENSVESANAKIDEFINAINEIIK